MRLFLCEKPSQARDIARVLDAHVKANGYLSGSGVIVTWCFGHLLEMVSPDGYDEQFKRWNLQSLPIIPRDWRVVVRREASKQFSAIQKLLSKLTSTDEVVIATDADREGETIGREVLERCGWKGATARLWLSALDDASIRKALSDLLPGESTKPLYWAGLGRARADWLVGMNLTRAFTLIGCPDGHNGVLSVGRVQTPTLRLLVDRDRLIEAFVPAPYWDVRVIFATHALHTFSAKWLVPDLVADNEGRCVNEEAARLLSQRINGTQATVKEVVTKRQREAPPLPFDLGSLQQEADRRYGMGAQQVLDIAQALYETHKAISYPRSDCPYLPQSMLAEAEAVMHALTRTDSSFAPVIAQAQLTLRSKAWNDTKISAHHAIIPTTSPFNADRLSKDESMLYDLIRRRYVAQFFPAHEYDRTIVTLIAGDDRFQASGRAILEPGWRSLFEFRVEEDISNGKGEDAQALPALVKDEQCLARNAEVEAKQTRPPARYTEGTLIGAMKQVAKLVTDPKLKQILKETSGLGTEATRAGIIQTLLKRGFARKQKKYLISTETGRALIDALPEPVKDPAITALWEQALDEIARGQGDLKAFVSRQAEWVKAVVEKAKSSLGVSAITEIAKAHSKKQSQRSASNRSATGSCSCGGEIIETTRAWQCHTCNSTVWKETYGKILTTRQSMALFAGEVIALDGLKSRAGKRFNAQAHLTDGKVKLIFKNQADPKRITSHAVERSIRVGNKCPSCRKGEVVKRFGKDGGAFLGCTRFPTCRHYARA
jgi:DNA topoisomerase-3